jgi:hypothetical protein
VNDSIAKANKLATANMMKQQLLQKQLNKKKKKKIKRDTLKNKAVK